MYFNPPGLRVKSSPLPKFAVDHTKCTTPFLCKKCLQACPTAVFVVHVTTEERLRETDPRLPGTYRLNAIYRNACTGCNKCVEACPVNALTISYP